MTEEMNNLIDQMAAHLAVQNTLCVDEDGVSRYEHDGMTCIIGCIVPTNVRETMAEGLAASDIYEYNGSFYQHMNKLLPNNTKGEIMEFLMLCQEYHDHYNGLALDLSYFEKNKVNLHGRHTTIRRRIKKYLAGDFTSGTL